MRKLFFIVLILFCGTEIFATNTTSFGTKQQVSLNVTSEHFSGFDILVKNSETRFEQLTDANLLRSEAVFLEYCFLDEALNCEVTITVTIGVVSVSGSVSGPCDEIKKHAMDLLRSLIKDAKEMVVD
jgi:hypothetical protein